MTESKLKAVTETLIARIQRGDFAPGQRLVETQLMGELGVSRNLLREAIRSLAEARLVEYRHNTGASIRRLTPQDIRHIYETREPLEGMAARLAALRADDADRAELTRLTDELDAAIEATDGRLFVHLNSAFHARIIAAARNPDMADLVGRLSIPLMRFQFITAIDRHAIRRSQEDHRKIASAIVAGHEDMAEKAMRAHMRNGLELVLGVA